MELLGFKRPFLLGLVSVSLLFFGACKERQSPRTTTVNFRKPPSSYQDTLRISERSAVFYAPDSLQSLRLKKLLGDRIYESDTHECIYMLRNTRNVINNYWPGLTVIESHAARWLDFKKWKNSTVVDLDNRNELCGLYLFDPGREPQLADMMNIETALNQYFSDK